MANAGEIVYRGREGTGAAQVYGDAVNPLSLYLNNERSKANNLLAQQRLALQNKKQGDAELGKVLAYKYEDPGERFRVWGQDVVNKSNQGVMDIFQANPDQDINILRPSIMQIQGQAQKDLNLAKEINNVYNEKATLLKDLKNVDSNEAQRLLNKTISVNSPYDVNREKLDNIQEFPSIYDKNSLVASSVDDIKSQFSGSDVGAIQKSPLGLFTEITDNKVRFKDYDKLMDYILRGDDVTELGNNQKINGGLISDRIRWDIAKRMVNDPTDEDQVMTKFKEIQYDKSYQPQVRKELRTILEQLNQEDRDVRIQGLGQFRQETGSEKSQRKAAEHRGAVLESLLNPYGAKNDLTKPDPKSQEALGRLYNADFGGGKVVGAEYQSGGKAFSPEDTQKLLSTFPGTPEFWDVVKVAKTRMVPAKGNAINFKAKTGLDLGEPIVGGIKLDLSDPASRAILNGMLSQKEKKITLDEVDEGSPDLDLTDGDNQEFDLDLTTD